MLRERIRAEFIGMFFNRLEFMYAVKCWGLVKGWGLPRERVGAELMEMLFNSLEFIYAVKCWCLVTRMGLA